MPDQTTDPLDQFIANLPPAPDVKGLVSQAAQKYGLDPDLLHSVAQHESGYNPAAVSPKGAIGPMQLMPDTAKSLGVDPNDPAENVEGGARYLKQLLDKYQGDTRKALAAYNAGEGRVDSGKPLPKETLDYVNAIAPQGGLDDFIHNLPPAPKDFSPAQQPQDSTDLDKFLSTLPPAPKDFPSQPLSLDQRQQNISALAKQVQQQGTDLAAEKQRLDLLSLPAGPSALQRSIEEQTSNLAGQADRLKSIGSLGVAGVPTAGEIDDFNNNLDSYKAGLQLWNGIPQAGADPKQIDQFNDQLGQHLQAVHSLQGQVAQFRKDAATPPAAPAESDEDEDAAAPASAYNLKQLVGMNAQGSLQSKWNGKQWVDMYTGKPTQAPLKQQWMQYGPEGLENSTPPANAYGPNAPGMPGNQPQAQPSGASPQILGEEPAAPKVGPGAPVSVYEHRAGTQLYSGPQGRLYRIPQAEPAEQPLSILPKPVQDVADELRGMIGVGPGSIPFEGLDKIAQGVYQLGDVANQVGWHAVEGTTATPGERLPQQAAGGAGKVIGGGLEIGSVLIPYHAITDPIRTVGTLAAWELASKGTEKGLEAAGVPQEYSELAGQIAGLGAGAAVAGPASAKIADLFKPGGRFGPGIDIGSLSDEQVMYGYMAARQSGDQAAQEMFGKEGMRRQAAYAADATADAHGHQGPGLEAPGAQPPPEAPAPQPPQPTPPPEPPPAATPPGGEPPAPEPTGQPPAPSAAPEPQQPVAPEPQSGPSPAPAPIAKGATYDTPQGTYKVEQLAGNRVMFTLNQNGKVTPGIRTTEDFKDLVGLPQGPVSTGIAGPAPTELNLNGGNVGPSPAGPTTFAGQTPNLPNLGGLKPIPEPQPEPVPGVAGFLQPSPAPAPPTAGPASIGQPVDYNQRPLTLPGGPQVSSTDLDQFIRNLPPAPASFAPPSPSAPAASPVSYTKPPVSYTKSATDRQPSLPGFSVQPDLSTGGSSQNEPAHEFSSTQVNLPSAVADKVRAAGAAIPDSQLAEDGREDQPHITVKYGLHGEDPAPVQQLLVNEPPITATLGKASVFKGEDGKPDVLKVDVESPDLHRLNAKIAALPHTDTFPTYQPHVTVAYLKPGEGKEYSGKDIPGVTGQQVTLNSVQFSGKSGQVLNIPLEGKPESQNSVSPEPPSGVSQPAPLDSRPAAVKLADAVYQQLRAGVPLGKQPDFYKKAELFFGSPRTSGQWDVKDAMDAMEAGVNKLLVERGADLMKMDPVEAIGELRKLQNLLPTQGTRTEEQLKAQQFSTPPAESFVAAKAAGITPSDVVLEPSAGNGGLAAWPKAIGAETHVNEISTRRAQMLEAAGFGKPTAHDGELINTLLDPSVKPTVVLMNPPFSSGALKSHQGKNRNQYGFNHVDQALQRLAPGGRLVAILGGGMANDPNGGASLTGGETGKWFDRLRKQYNIRANVRVNGKEYQKYGTNFATRIIVIDKSGPLKSWSDIVTGNVDTLEEAYNLLKNVAADRPTPQVSAGAGSPLRPGQGQPATGVGAGAQPGGNGGGALLPGGGGTPEAGGPGNRPNGPPGEPGPDRSGAGGESAGVQQPGPRTPEPSVPPGAAGPEGRPQPDDLRPVRSDGQPAGDGQPSAPSLTPQQQATPLTGDEGSPDLAPVEQEDQPLSERQEGQAYVTYRPAIKGAAHPGDIVETTTMATVKLPKATYRPNLPANVGISAVQMEAVQMAGQQNEILLPGGFRAAALIGDGTGVGKGREAAAYLWDNWRQGRKRLVWVSKNWDLVQDAMRDLTGIGAGDEMLRGIEKQPSGKFVITPKSSVQPLNRWNYTAKIDHQGLVYSTYGTVRAKDKKGNRRVAQLEAYLRGDDDGEGAAIVFDESHTLKNAVPARGTPASQIGQAVKDLLQRIPKLRTLSLSATAATDVVNLGYLDRLGLWGPGTPFPNGFQEFQSKIGTGGISAMEMIARELKAQGKYISRTLSFHGVDYDTAEHALTDDQKELYRTAAQAWSTVLGNASQTIDTVTNGGGEQRGNFLSQFYGTQQRFFNLLITTLKIPTAVDLANKALAEGKAVVITLVNTNEAAQNREKNKALGEGDDDEAIPDYDFGPKEMLVELVKNHYPTQQYQDDVNDDGDPIKVPMYTTDAEGREISVQNPTAVAARDALIEQINRDLHMPENPLDILIQSLGGPRKVAELTGRKERFDRTLGKFIPRGDPNVPQKDINLVEMRNFQGGKKDVAVLSAAADTGISLHAGNDVANQKRRFHITLQAGWSADKAMQMLGRTHRTNQVHPPQYVMLVSDLGGEKRFVSTISRRLGSLGALTKGQKNATGGNDLMDKVNFETDQGRQATNTFYERMLANQAIPGTDLTGMQILHDLHVLRPSGGGGMTVPPAERTNVTRLLNRLLALDPDTQNPVYNYFYDIFQASVQDAIERGTLDTGVKTMPGDEFHVKEQRVIATDPKTGAQTFYYPVDASVRTQAVSPAELTKRLVQHATENPTFFVNDKGEVALAIDAPPIVSASGRVTPALYTSRPGNGKWTKIPRGNFPRGTREVTQATEQDVTKATNDLASAERNLNLYRNYAERNPGATWWADGLKGAQERLQEAQTALATARAMAQDPIGWAKQRWAEQYQDAPKHTTQERHLIGGAVLRYWNPIRDVGGHTIYTAVDSGTGQRVVGVEIDPHEIGGLLQRISGGASTVNTAQLIADVLRNNLSYTLEGGIQVRPGRIGREPVIQLIPPNRDVAENLKRLGVLYEKGVQPVYYVPNAESQVPANKTRTAILDKILEQYPVRPETPGAEDRPQFMRAPLPAAQFTKHGPIQFRAHGNAIVTTPAGLRALASVWGETATMSGVALNRRHALMAADALQGTSKPLAQAIAKAANLPGSGSVVIADGENSLKDTATILRHERWHLTQDRLRGFLDNHLGSREQEFLNLPLARVASIPLKMMGYATHELAAELGAHLAAGQYERLGLSRPQWKQLFHTYLQLLKAEHGDKLKEALTSVHPALQEAVRAATATESTDTAAADRPGAVVQGGVRQETGRAASRGTPQFARAGPGQGRVREFLSSETGTSTVIPAIAEAAQGLAKAKDDILKLLAPAALEGAQPGAMVIRHRAAEMAQRTARAEKALESARDAFRKMPEADRWAWFDRVENGAPDPDPTLESIAKLVRGLLDGRRADVQALGTGKLQKWIENYMPHAYKDPQKAGQVIGEYYSKRPMEGSKSFLKARKFETIADGMAAGLVPISDNPMDLVLLKLREMDKYIMAHRVLNDLKAQGLSKYVSVFDERPPGWQQIDDRVGTVYGPPTVTVKEAYDKALMERLDSLASSLGIQHIRKVAIGGQRLGYTSQGGPIVTKFAGPESILIHEIGHQLEFKFGLWDRLKNLKYPDREKELRALADLRYEGDPNVSKSFKSYVREKDEKIANAVAALVYAPERFQEVAPNTWDALRDELWHIPAARPLFEARRSMTLGTRTAEVPVGGMVTMGHWAMPEPVARLVNNYLSPGLAQSQLYRLYQQAGNTLNNFQLGFSAFHLGFTSIDAATSGLALGIYQAAHGHPVQGLVNALKSPVEVLGVPLGLAAKGAEKLGVKGATSAAAPVSSFLRGDRMLQEYYKPGSQGAQIADMVSALIIGGGRARMDRMYQTNTTQKMMDAFHRGGFGILAGALRIPFALAEQSVRPILDYIVPRQKLGVFADLAEFELQRMGAGEIQTEQLPALLARAWDSVDNRLGQLVYDNLFWNKIVKDLLMVSVRSVGWNTGTIREILGGAADARKMASGDPEMSTRLSYVLALPIMVALIGSLVHYLYNGKGPESLADTFQPRTGRPDKSGQPERVNLPSYIKDVIGVEEKGLWKTAKDKIHPLLTLIADELANEDFRHKPIVEPDDPFLLSVQKRLLFALSSYESMAQRNIQKERERNATGASEYIAPFFGVTPAPAPANRMLRPAPAPTPFRPARQVHPHKPRKAA